MKAVMLMHFLFNILEKELNHSKKQILTGGLLNQTCEHVKYMEMLSSSNPFMISLTGFDGSANSCNTNFWLHWLINKEVLSLVRINTRNQSVKINALNPYEID